MVDKTDLENARVLFFGGRGQGLAIQAVPGLALSTSS